MSDYSNKVEMKVVVMTLEVKGEEGVGNEAAVTDSPEAASGIIEVEVTTAGTTKAQATVKKIVPAVGGSIPAAAEKVFISFPMLQ